MEMVSSVRGAFRFAKKDKDTSAPKFSKRAARKSLDVSAFADGENVANDKNNNSTNAASKGSVKKGKKTFAIRFSKRTSRASLDVSTPAANETSDRNDDSFALFGPSTGDSSAFSRPREVRIGVTRKSLKKVLRRTRKAEEASPTEELTLEGARAPSRVDTGSLDSKCMGRLRSSCPSIKILNLRSLNLCAARVSRKLNVRGFPENLTQLSLRESTFEPGTLFVGASASTLPKLEVLDLGRPTVHSNGNLILPAVLPKFENLKELYLEGALRAQSIRPLEIVLDKFPNLEILDLEGTELGQGDLVKVAEHVPNLRKLFVGYTELRDASVMQLEEIEFRFQRLNTICLIETKITAVGLEYLRRACPSLSRVPERGMSGRGIRHGRDTTVFGVFRHQGCGHFTTESDGVTE